MESNPVVWDLVVAVAAALIGVTLGWWLTKRSADAQWDREQEAIKVRWEAELRARAVERTDKVVAELHLTAMDVARLGEISDPRRTPESRRMIDAGRLVSARAKLTHPKMSKLVEELAKMAIGDATERDMRQVAFALASASAVWLRSPEDFEKSPFTAEGLFKDEGELMESSQ